MLHIIPKLLPLADIRIDIESNDQSFVNALQRAIGLLDRAEDKVSDFNKSAKFNPKGINTYNKSVSGVLGNVSLLSGAFTSLAAIAGTAFSVVAIGQAANAVGDFVGEGVRAAAEYEKTKIAFETFLGSAERAQKVLDELGDFSTRTPFTPNEVIENGRLLLAFGESADTLTGTLGRLGDIASGVSQPLDRISLIYGQVLAKGRLQGEELLQFAEAGVPLLSTLAETLGKTEAETQELVSKGKIGFNEFSDAINALTDEGGKFFGLTERQSQSVAGRISTLQGVLGQLQKRVGEQFLPILGLLVDKATAFLDSIDGDVLDRFGDVIENTVLPSLEGLFDALGELFDAVINTNDGFEQAAPTVEDYIGALVGVIDVLTDTVDFVRRTWQENEALRVGLQLLANYLSNTVKGALLIANAAFQSLEFQFELIRQAINATLLPLNLLLQGLRSAGIISEEAKDVSNFFKVAGDSVDDFADKLRDSVKITNKKPIVDPEPSKEALKELKRISDEYNKLLEKVNSESLSAELASLNDEDRIRREAQLSIEAINQLENEFNQAAQRRAQAESGFVAPDLSSDFDSIRSQIKREENEALLDLERQRIRDRISAFEAEQALDAAEINGRVFSAGQITTAEEEKQKAILREKRRGLAERLAIISDLSGIEFETERQELRNQSESLSAEIAKINRDAFVRDLEQKEQLRLQEAELIQDDTDNILTLEQEKEQKRLEIQIEFARKRLALTRAENGEDSFEALSLENTIASLENDLAAIQSASEGFVDPIGAAFDRLKLKIEDALSLPEGGAEQLLGGLQNLGQQIFQAFESVNEAQIEANQRYIDSLNERIEATQNALDSELEAQEQGQANNVALREQELEDLKAQQRDALAQQRQFQKQQERIQTIQQSINLITASAQVYQSLAGLGPIGIAIAAATIATMFAAFATAKARARRLSQFRKGGLITDGHLHEGGGRVIEAERGEFVVSRPGTRGNEAFLSEMNKGKYKGVDLKSLLDNMDSVGGSVSDLNIYESINSNQMRAIMKDEVTKPLREQSKILQGIMDKPSLLGSPDDYVVMTKNGAKRMKR